MESPVRTMSPDPLPTPRQHVLPESTPFIIGDTPEPVPAGSDETPDLTEHHLETARQRFDSLANLSIDELRSLASKLGVPEVGAITESDELIDEIKARLVGTSLDESEADRMRNRPR